MKLTGFVWQQEVSAAFDQVQIHSHIHSAPVRNSHMINWKPAARQADAQECGLTSFQMRTNKNNQLKDAKTPRSREDLISPANITFNRFFRQICRWRIGCHDGEQYSEKTEVLTDYSTAPWLRAFQLEKHLLPCFQFLYCHFQTAVGLEAHY